MIILKKPRKSSVVVCSIWMIELYELYELYQSHCICQITCETFTHVFEKESLMMQRLTASMLSLRMNVNFWKICSSKWVPSDVFLKYVLLVKAVKTIPISR